MPKPDRIPPGKDKTREPKPSSIKISGPSQVSENDKAPFTCTAYYRDGSSQDVTGQTNWQVNPNLATFNGGEMTTGDVSVNTACMITATFGGKTATHAVTIIDAQSSPPDQEPPSTSPSRIVIDPVTRIEGHLRIEVEVRNGEVVDAWSSGMLFRGIELILQNRNPEEAWLITQRLCGVCTYVHGSTSVRCVEDALNLTVPDNARIIRNLLMGAQYLHDHIIHFYHLHALDWVDLLSALSAEPANAAGPGATATELLAAQQRLQNFVDGGQLGPFAGHYWPHADVFSLSPEENLLLAAHYLKALELQTRTARMHAIFGGKNPHPQSLRVGGVTCRYDLNTARINEFEGLLRETINFIDQIYIPDVILLAQAYSEWAGIGGNNNFLAYGEFPSGNNEPADLFFPRGVITERGNVAALQVSQIEEHVQHSWYGGPSASHPSNGQTLPSYDGYDTDKRYSWLKAPRYNGNPMEVGPLARMLVAYGNGHLQAKPAVENFLVDAGLGAGNINALFSTLGRTAARALETQIIANEMVKWIRLLDTNGATYRTATMPAQASGMGLNEAPRGAVGHWIEIQNQKIGNYQMVIPSTWNFGPRCVADKRGPAEEALIGTPVADPAKPVEILRTIHSLDPCIACAVHVIDPGNNKDYTVRVY